jgi:structure-specific recognition protein 1
VSPNYTSAQGFHGIKCSLKAAECYLFPLEKGFLALPKPTIFIRFVEIAAVTFSRVTTAATSTTKTFEVKFSMTNGQDYSFSSIPKEEHERIESFCRLKNLSIQNEIGDERQYVTMAEDGFGTESEDEDFVAGGSDSDVNEEFNEDYDSEAGSDEGSAKGSGEDEDDIEESGQQSSKSSKNVPKKRKEKTSGGPAETKKPKKEKKVGPKRPTTSFLYFANETRASIKQANPSMTIGEVGKELGERWKTMSVEAKSKYEELAKADKERYSREMEIFKRTGVWEGVKAVEKSKGESKKSESSKPAFASEKSAEPPMLSAEYVVDDEDDDDF